VVAADFADSILIDCFVAGNDRSTSGARSLLSCGRVGSGLLDSVWLQRIGEPVQLVSHFVRMVIDPPPAMC
jgi:hypothetical protein